MQWNEEEEAPTSPSTEFPDPFAAFLPGYYRSVDEDPNAEVSLDFTPQDPERVVDYTEPPSEPPPEDYEGSIAASDVTSIPESYRYHQSVDSGASIMERWTSATDVPTFISMSASFSVK